MLICKVVKIAFKIVIKRNPIILAGDSHIVIPVEVLLADHMYLVTLGVKSHLPGARCVPVFLTRIKEEITSVHPGEPVIQFQLPVPAVSHIYGSGKEYLGEAPV